MQITLTELAAKIGAELIASNPSVITGIAPLNKANQQKISFFCCNTNQIEVALK